MNAIDIKTLLNTALAVIPIAIGMITIYVRMEKAISSIKTDISWLKNKSIERRGIYTHEHHETD